MELDEEGRQALETVRRRILETPDFPVPPEDRARLADYRLRVAGPGQASVYVEVDVVRGGIDADEDERETVARQVEMTPQVLAESPGDLRYYAAWNHVARVFVIWLTPRALAALRDGRDPDRPGRVLPLADGPSSSPGHGDEP